MRFLESDNFVDQAVMFYISQRWIRRRQELDKSLAQDIANSIWKAVKT